jgi:hypothetical protein
MGSALSYECFVRNICFIEVWKSPWQVQPLFVKDENNNLQAFTLTGIQMRRFPAPNVGHASEGAGHHLASSGGASPKP